MCRSYADIAPPTPPLIPVPITIPRQEKVDTACISRDLSRHPALSMRVVPPSQHLPPPKCLSTNTPTLPDTHLRPPSASAVNNPVCGYLEDLPLRGHKHGVSRHPHGGSSAHQTLRTRASGVDATDGLLSHPSASSFASFLGPPMSVLLPLVQPSSTVSISVGIPSVLLLLLSTLLPVILLPLWLLLSLLLAIRRCCCRIGSGRKHPSRLELRKARRTATERSL